jgi:hypothetical protein
MEPKYLWIELVQNIQIQICEFEYFWYNSNSINPFQLILFANGSFWCPLSNTTTAKDIWTILKSFKFKLVNLSIFTLVQILQVIFNWFLLYMEDIETLYPVASFLKFLNLFASIQNQIWEFEYFQYRINSIILSNKIPSTKVNQMIISICPNHFNTLSRPIIMPSYSWWPSTHYSNSNWVFE